MSPRGHHKFWGRDWSPTNISPTQLSRKDRYSENKRITNLPYFDSKVHGVHDLFNKRRLVPPSYSNKESSFSSFPVLAPSLQYSLTHRRYRRQGLRCVKVLTKIYVLYEPHVHRKRLEGPLGFEVRDPSRFVVPLSHLPTSSFLVPLYVVGHHL